jgi:hypothetical protein
VLEYLGMTLDYTCRNKVKISMYEFVNKMLTKLPADMYGMATTPATNHLFVLYYCPAIPSSSGNTAIPVKMHKTRHTDSNGISMYQGTIAQ